MLQLFDKNNRKIALLNKCKNICVESVLESGDKTLSFLYPSDDIFNNEIEEETYIRTRYDEFVVKTKAKVNEMDSYVCKLNVENLTGNFFDRFDSKEQPLLNALNLAVVGTGWIINIDNYSKNIKRTIRKVATNSWNILKDVKKVYGVDIRYDTLNKVIYIYDSLGSDRGIYFIDSLNLKALQVQSNSYDFYTRIVPQGKNGLTIESVNGGVGYLENKKYSSKTLTYFWKDERYTNPQSLKEDALRKLNSMCIPYKSYIALISNLAKINEEYKDILDYELGDTVTLISRQKNVKEKQRIVKIKEYPQDHSKDTVELANKSLNLDTEKLKVDEIGETIDNVTTDNGTLKGSTIDGITTKQIEDFEANVIKVTNLKAVYAEIETLKVGKADIQNLNAVTARIGTLESTKANITDLTSTNIKVANLEANKATITDLNAASGKISVLESKTASIDNLLAGNITAKNIATNAITAGSGIIADGAIGDAQISSLNANKMRAGTLDTSLVTVCGPQGRLKILGNKLQIFDDVNNKLFERIMLGINENNRASLTLRGSDGQTVLLTEEGLTKAGITDGFNKADDNSLNASKFDKNSIVRQVNGATESINGTRVQVGDRSLDIELSTQKNTITNNSKELSSQKTTIQALDNAIKLKVDTQTYTNSINAINNNISTTNSNLSKATSELIILKGQVSSKVSQSDIDKSISEVEIGGRNLAVDTEKVREYSGFSGRVNDCQLYVTTFKRNLSVGDFVTVSGILTYENIIGVPNKSISAYLQNCGNITNWNGGGLGGCGFKIKTGVYKEEIPFSFTFIFTKDMDKNESWSYMVRFDNVESGKVALKQFKMEKGNKATDWTPAPEDTEQLIADNIKTVTEKISTVESKFLQKANSIEANVSNLESFTNTKIINAKNEAILDARNIPDTRNDNQSPRWYIDHYPQQTITEFKFSDIVNIPKSRTYGTLETQTPWVDSSGGYPTQTFRSNNKPTYQRRGLDLDNWSAWEQIEDTKGAQDKADNALNSAKVYTNAQITTVNNKVHNVESNLSILSEKISTKVSQSDIDNSISIIEIGGRNYFKTTTKIESYSNPKAKVIKMPEINGFQISNNQPVLTTYRLLDVVKPKGTFTVSGYVRGNLGSVNSFQMDINDVQNFAVSVPPKISGDWSEWTKFEITVVSNKDNQIYNFVDIAYSAWSSYQFKNVKIERGTKATDFTLAPEDVDKLVVDCVKVVDTKINNVSSELTQKTNSLQASINSVSSKTNSIETTLNGKATKQEVTNVNNRITTITADLGGITNRVSNTESRVNTLNGQVQNAVTKNEFTEYKQNSDNFKWKVEKGYGGNNIIKDSMFNTVGIDENIWYDIAYSFNGNGTSYTSWGDWSEWILTGTNALVIRGQNNTNEYGEYAVRQDIKLKPNTKYTLTGLVAAHRSEAHVHIYDKDFGWIAHKKIEKDKYGGGKSENAWCRVELHFTTGGNVEKLKNSHIDLTIGACRKDGYCFFTQIMLCEGDLAQAFQPNNYEVYGSTMKLDENKLRCNYSDNSYIQMGKEGFEWWKNGMKHPYHCLMARGSVDKVNSGQTVRIWLPEVFRGKEYEIGWWTGNVFPANPTDCLFAVNTELTRQNKNEGWFEVKMSVMVRNPNKESNPQWRGKANVVWIAIA